ncbi:MAG: hypothetical protein KDD58_16165 [Bdellovibrionales bacterium]|nr:hypothetical protein [Bdellovibrionales bacterium]
MELEVLKKKVSTYKGPKGRVSITSNELLLEILSAWEQWTGPAEGFYKALGISRNGISSIIGRAKKLRREGFPEPDFKEIQVADRPVSNSDCSGAEIIWDNGRLIRFRQVELLIDFLKKVV